MLLITRRTGESIIINGSIHVTVVQVRGGRVKLGFEYPEGNTIYREELYTKIQEENRAAAKQTDKGKLDQFLQNITKKEPNNKNERNENNDE